MRCVVVRGRRNPSKTFFFLLLDQEQKKKMIIGLLILLLVVAAILLVLGFLIEDNWGYLGIAGAVLLMITGLLLSGNPLEIPRGYNTYYIYGNNFTDNAFHWDTIHSADAPDFSDKTLNDPDGVFLLHEINEQSYESPDEIINALLWFIIFSVGFFLFILSVLNIRKFKKRKHEPEEELESGLAESLRE